ncbi:MAG: DUF1800 domain-containing protein [Chloroflexi bacterium]|nr:DUF1800 domain-containing protein [Chloroflexota bacterium]
MDTNPMTRRDFLKLTGLGAALAALSACDPRTPGPRPGEATPAGTPTAGPVPPAATPSPAPTGAPATGDDLLLHTLRRVTYGPGAEDLARAREIGLQAYLEEQLNPEALDDAPVERLLGNFPTLSLSAEEMFRRQQELRGETVRELVAATILRQVYSRRQLYERMVEFWSDHFNINIASGVLRFLKPVDDREVIRPHALGNFGDLLRASAHSPAMLVYLNQAESTKRGPNENYARELMELHTLGADQGYTQLDVAEVARALTGWTVVGPRQRRGGQPGTFVYLPEIHDDGEKLILGQHFPPGQGQADGDRVLELLLAHPGTARYLAWKLGRRFVADDPPAALVDEVAAAYTASGGEIKAMLRALFAGEAFRRAAGQKLKRPLEFFVSAARVTGAPVAQFRGIARVIEGLGQMPFHWPTPDGYPKSVELAGNPVADAHSILLDFARGGPLRERLPTLASLILASPHFQMR